VFTEEALGEGLEVFTGLGEGEGVGGLGPVELVAGGLSGDPDLADGGVGSDDEFGRAVFEDDVHDAVVVFELKGAVVVFGCDEGLLEGFEGAVGFAAEGGFVDHMFSLSGWILLRFDIEAGENVGGLGTDAEVGVCLGEGNGVGAVDDEDGGKGKTPAGLRGVVVTEAGVVEGDIDEDGLEVATVLRGNGVGDTESFCDDGAGVGEQRVVKTVLLEGEVILARGLGGDGDEEDTALAELRVEVAPGFQFGDTVRAPAAAEEVDDEWAEGEEVSGTDGLVRESVFKGEGRSLCSDLQDTVLDAGVEEICGCFFGDCETLGLHEGAGVLGDAVELVL
jgi:hypothetical protein